MNDNLQTYIVKKVTQEVPGVTTLSLTCKNEAIFKYVPGQYINVFFPKFTTPEGKAYSISSAPNESLFTITVRNVGKFSNLLTSMKKNDILQGSLPYGFFQPEYSETNLIMLAAGIGVTPFRSMICDAATQDFKRKINLFYSIRTSEDALFVDEFTYFSKKYKNFLLTHFVTREEKPTLSSAIQSRTDIQKVLDAVQDDIQTEFLLCGSISFTRDMWKALIKKGIPEDFIYTEAFFSH